MLNQTFDTMKGNRVYYFDVLNVVSCFSVVCLHSNGYIHTFIKDEWWWLRVAVEVLFYFAVPVFFMLSGATLLNYRERYSTFDFYRKRFIKTFIPYLVWGATFYLFSLWRYGINGFSYSKIIDSFTTGKIPFTNYWFFIPLFFLYIFMPFLSIMVNNLKEKQKLYLILILVLFQSIVPEIYASFGLSFKTSLPIGGFFLYALLGYFLSKNEFDKCNKVLYSLAAFATISLIVRYVMIYESEVKSNTCFTYFGLFAILPSMLIFLIVKRFYVHSHVTFFTWLSRKSYGIFLIHTFFITMLSRVFPMNHPLFIPISAIFIYLFSAVIVHILQKSRATKWLVP